MSLRRVAAAFAGVFACIAGADLVHAQPFNVRAWYAQGQVFVVWQFPAPPVNQTDTVEIYASATAQAQTTLMTQVGRMFYPEYIGGRLRALAPSATLTVPTPAGGTYTLMPDEGVFVYTPRAAGALFFAVVDTGSTAVVPANSAATNFIYDPVLDPVRPHPQFGFFTPAGNPATAYVVWGEGRADYDNARPDIPVLGNADKNGVPHVFVITEPIGGVPPGALKCALVLHGGDDNYALFLPGVPARANMSLSLTNGIVVTPDDAFYGRNETALELHNTDWFGYDGALNAFDAAPRTNPPLTATIVNFTQRRVFWIMDWLIGPTSPYTVDAARIAVVGHSMGARGASHISRTAPERFCAAVLYCPAINFQPNPTGMVQFLRGDITENRPTNLPRPGGGVNLGLREVFTPTVRVSLSQRDLPLTRSFFGKRDTSGPAVWDEDMRAILDSMDDSALGYMIFWDEREHGVEAWGVENATPGPDIGQWIAPVRTRRASCQYLVNTYRSDQSYPGFFNADQDPSVPGQQLNPGPGDPDLGAPWGTWGGYFDWDMSTIVDQPTRWECTVYAAAFQPASVDNAPVTTFTATVGPRKTIAFNPAPGTTIYSYAMPEGGTTVTNQATGNVVDANGRVTGLDISLRREDVGRVRVYFSTTPLCLGSSSLTNPSSMQVCPGQPASLGVVATGSAPWSYQWQYALAGSPGVWTNLADGAVPGVGTVSGATTAALALSTVDASGNRFRCIATNACGSLTSNAAIVAIVACCDPDVNCDGSADGFDVEAMEQMVGGDTTNFCQADADFNGDGSVDGFDVEAVESVVGGGPCP